MTKQEQIEEMVKVMPEKIKDPLDNSRYIIFGKSLRREIARIYYDAGYRKASDGALKLLLEAPYDELRKFCIKYYNEAKDLRQEVVELKVDNEHLTNKLRYILLSIDTVKEMNAMCNIDEHRKQAIKEFAEKVKSKLQDFSDGGEKGAYITEKDIDELLKEYEI